MRRSRMTGLVAVAGLLFIHPGGIAVAQPPAPAPQRADEVADAFLKQIEFARAERAKTHPGWAAIVRAIERYKAGDREGARASKEMAGLVDPMILVKLRAERACEGAYSALKSSDMEAARAGFDEALRLDPTLVPALRGRASLAHGRGDHAAALADAKVAVVVEPANAGAWGELATEYWWLGRLDDAISAISQAIHLAPEIAELHQCRGDIQAARKRFAAAVADFTEVLRLSEDSMKTRSATADFTEFLRLHEAAKKAHSARALARCYQGDWAGVEGDSSALIRLDPTNGFGHKMLGVAREMQGRYASALSDFEDALLLQPDSLDVRAHRGLCRFRLGDAPGALADANGVLGVDPTSADAYYVRSLARHALRDHLGARRDIDEAVRRKPDDVLFLTVRAQTLATCVEDRARDGKEALASARRAVELTEGRDHKALDALAWALAASGDRRAAVARQWETIRHDPAGKAHLIDFTRLATLALHLSIRESSDAPAPLEGDRLTFFASLLDGAGVVVKVAHDGVFQLSLYKLTFLPIPLPFLEIYRPPPKPSSSLLG